MTWSLPTSVTSEPEYFAIRILSPTLTAIGWTAPFSSRFFSDRQSTYGSRFGLASVYTPQMVVDGAVEFVGGDSHLVVKEIQKALPTPKSGIRILGI